MKRAIAFLITALLIPCLIHGVPAHAADERSPVSAESVADGVYPIEVTSSSSMFRIIDCQLTVSQGEMTAVITLSGHGYEKLFMGTGKEALAASDTEYIYYAENSDGKYTYTVPVDTLNTRLDCAAWSIRKQKWYDRTIVFEADTLPNGAVQDSNPAALIISAAAAVLAAASAAVIFISKRRKKQMASL